MNKGKDNEDATCSSTVNSILGSNKTAMEINSNVLIKFNLTTCLPLPSDVKIEILETKLTYNICNVEKDILLNGHKIKSNISSLNDKLYLKKEYFNVADKEAIKILLNITELIKLKILISLEIEALAHIENYKPILFKAIGETEDCIETILMTKTCIPNCKYKLDNAKISLDNNLSSIINPDYIFLSPIYDDYLDINSFIGNVYINYCVGLSVCTYSTVNKSCYHHYTKNKNLHCKSIIQNN